MTALLRKFLLALSLIPAANAALPQVAIVPGDVLAMLRPDASAERIAADLSTVDGTATGLHAVREISAPMRAWLFHFDPGAIPQGIMLRAFRAHPAVQLAQVNHVVQERDTPDDPQFSQQWWHQNIQSEQAWDITTGGVTAAGDTIVVAIIEKADLTHPDLGANAWVNHHEIAGNGIDDDANGYVDDVRGWNPGTDNDDVYGGSHGTEVAGMIGAVGNNGNQVVGANWHVKMMPVHYQNTAESSVIESYTYPLVMRRLYNSTGGAKGAFVVATNASWGVDGGQPADAPLWCAMYDTLGTAGVLNCGATTNNNVDVDVVGDLPTACPSDFLISVTATNSADMRTFSGYGDTTVDLGAPGANVLTTTIGGGTGTATGTSFASPLTAGVVALLYSVPCASLAALAHNDPQEAAARVKQALLNGVDQVGNLPGNTVTGGRINAFNSVQLLMDSCSACPAPYGLSASSNAIGAATISWNALPGTYTVRYRLQGTTDWTTVTGIIGTELPISGLGTCVPYEFQVSADCDSAASDFSPILTWTSEGCCTAPITITASATDSISATVTWSTVLASTTYDLRYRPVGGSAWTEADGLSGNSTTLTGLTPCSDMEVQMRSSCGGTVADWSASVNFHVPGCGQCVEGNFCTSGGDDASYEWIARVKLGSIDRSSSADGGYADLATTAQSTQLLIGSTNAVLLVPGYSGSSFPEYFTVWMDLDRDGLFEANELVFDAGSTVSGPLNDSLTVPASATEGSVRMRVVMSYNAPVPDGCGTYDFGETEDYCVALTNTISGINDNVAGVAVRIDPQPANEGFVLSTDHAGAMQLDLTDAAGRSVLQQSFSGDRTEVRTAGLGQGMYLLQLRSGGQVIFRGPVLVVH